MTYGGVPLAKLSQESLPVCGGERGFHVAHLPLGMSNG
jgi:hypothetical protein